MTEEHVRAKFEATMDAIAMLGPERASDARVLLYANLVDAAKEIVAAIDGRPFVRVDLPVARN